MTSEPVILRVTIPGEPVAKGRPRFTKTGRAFTPAKTMRAEDHIRQCMFSQVGQPVLEGPLDVEAICTFPIPQSWSKRKQGDALAGVVRPTGRPDLENVVKALLDAGNGIIWRDDSQVCGLRASKIYGAKLGVLLTVSRPKGERGP